jgi:hypothetical protein
MERTTVSVVTSRSRNRGKTKKKQRIFNWIRLRFEATGLKNRQSVAEYWVEGLNFFQAHLRSTGAGPVGGNGLGDPPECCSAALAITLMLGYVMPF